MSKITKDFRQSSLRNGILVRPSGERGEVDDLRWAAFLELLNLGFQVEINDLGGIPVDYLQKTIDDCRTIVGGNRDMTPIYPGFPDQVSNLDTVTILSDQVLNYLSGGKFIPDHPVFLREGLPLEDAIRDSKMLEVMQDREAARFFMKNLPVRGVALSEDEISLLKGSVDFLSPSLEDIADIVGSSNHGENQQSLIIAAYETGLFTRKEMVEALAPKVSNVDHLLRLVLAVTTEPVVGRELDYIKAVRHLTRSQESAVRMVNLPRSARRTIVGRLGELSNGYRADALISRMDMWRRVMRMIHPFDLKMSDASRRAVDIIHSNIDHRTFNSEVEDALENRRVSEAVALLRDNRPGDLLRRIAKILRLSSTDDQVDDLVEALKAKSGNAPITTLISSYNGVLSINNDRAKVTRVAGSRNVVRGSNAEKVDQNYVDKVISALSEIITDKLKTKDAPQSSVGIVGTNPVPLVRRDLSSTDQVMDRGTAISIAGEGDTIRVFNHWINNMNSGGYMDTGIVVLDSDYNKMAVVTWNTHTQDENRQWSVYSGDCHVPVGEQAAEYIDVDVNKLKKVHPDAKWIAMTIQSWSGFPTCKVDLIAGVMLRSKPNSGEVFEPRTMTTAFKPTTEALQSVPLVVNLETMEMIWIDSSNGSNESHVSALDDDTVGDIVYDEIVRPRLTMGELAEMWADAHSAEKEDSPVDRDAILGLLD